MTSSDDTWEALRLRRLKASFMNGEAQNSLVTVLERLGCDNERFELSKEWAQRKPSAIKRVDRLLASADLTMDAVLAQTLSDNLDQVERIDRMIALAEARRNATLREIERHRATLAHALRPIIQQIEEIESQVVDTDSVEEDNVA